nr:copia protein [Tanacetum cinerariifolium]
MDHGREFDNEVQFGEFCNANGIPHNFLAPRPSQSNGMVERKNSILQEMSRTMLNEQSLPQNFWCNVIDTSTYILNRILIRVILGKTPYELLRGRKPTLDYFGVFGSKCFILNTKDYHTKFDPKSYEESLNVTFDETPPPSKTSPLVDDDLDKEEAIKVIEKKNLENNIEDKTLEVDEIVNIKARLVDQGYNQQEGIDYDKTYALITRLESIRILLAYACALDFKLFQIDVKSTFLNGFINEEVYVAQPLGFIDFEKPDHVYKLKKALYGLKQAPKDWFFFSITLIASSLSKSSSTKGDVLEGGGVSSNVTLSTDIEIVVYANPDHARDYVDQKSTSGICTFVGCCLTSWFLKKQNAFAISTIEAEYVSAKKACQQALWRKQALIDYDIRLDDVPIMCDNKGTIDFSKKLGATLAD